MKELRLNIPTQTVKLKNKQLLFISRLFLMNYAETEFLVKALLYLSGLKVIKGSKNILSPSGEMSEGQRGTWFKHRSLKKPFILDADQLVVMSKKCAYLLESNEVTPITWINFSRARHYRLYNASFEEYLMAENYYFAYVSTGKKQHLCNLMSILYRRPWHRWNAKKIQKRAVIFKNVKPEVKNSAFMWYVGFRALVPQRCPNLFSGKEAGGDFNIRDYINGMVHQLNNSNITLNDKLLQRPVWDALYELEQRAIDANNIKEANKKT